MLNSILIGPTQGLSLALQGMCAELKEIFLYKVLDNYPKPVELARLLNIFDPEVLLLELTSGEEALGVAERLRELRPNAVILGFARQCDKSCLSRAAQLGVKEVLLTPFTMEDVRKALLRGFEARVASIFENVIGLLPAKPGSGCSTAAIHIAGALGGQLKKKVLLIDADRRSGVLSVLLNLNSEHTLLEALEHSHELDDGSWSYWSLKTHGFDLLPAPRIESPTAFPPWCYQRLLKFLTSRYDMVMVDLPETPESGGEAFVRQAKTVYIVCTPEPASLFLASRRIHELRSRGLGDDRMAVIVNRCPQGEEVALPTIEAELGLPVTAVLPEGFQTLREAAFSSTLVSERSEIGLAFHKLARKVAGISESIPFPETPHTGLRSLFRKRAISTV